MLRARKHSINFVCFYALLIKVAIYCHKAPLNALKPGQGQWLWQKLHLTSKTAVHQLVVVYRSFFKFLAESRSEIVDEGTLRMQAKRAQVAIYICRNSQSAWIYWHFHKLQTTIKRWQSKGGQQLAALLLCHTRWHFYYFAKLLCSESFRAGIENFLVLYRKYNEICEIWFKMWKKGVLHWKKDLVKYTSNNKAFVKVNQK